MSLRDLRRHDGERGYAMAALLVTLAIMAILLSIAMPVWRHEAQREKEAELVFRGEQYARAIALFRFKNANVPNAFPPSIDSLVEGPLPAQEIQGPDDEGRRVRPASASAARNLAHQPASRRNPARPRHHRAVRRNTPRSSAQPGCGRHDRASAARARKTPSAAIAARRATTSGSSRSTSPRAPAAPCRWPTRPTAAATTPPGATFPGSVPGGQARRPGPARATQRPGGRGPGGVGPGGEDCTPPPVCRDRAAAIAASRQACTRPWFRVLQWSSRSPRSTSPRKSIHRAQYPAPHSSRCRSPVLLSD